MTAVDANAADFRTCFICHGARVALVADPPSAAVIAGILPPDTVAVESGAVDCTFAVHAAATDRGREARFDLVQDGRLLSACLLRHELRAALASRLHATVARHAPQRLFVHAGVVGWRGRALLFPGSSMSGKTTLVSALLEAGATYYSDEYAVLDADGLVHPYARAMNRRALLGSTGSSGPPAPETLRRMSSERADAAEPSRNGDRALPPLMPGLIVFSRFRPDAVWKPRALHPSEVFLRLVTNTVVARVKPRLTLDLLAPLALSTRAFVSHRGEAGSIIEHILELSELHLERRQSPFSAVGSLQPSI